MLSGRSLAPAIAATLSIALAVGGIVDHRCRSLDVAEAGLPPPSPARALANVAAPRLVQDPASGGLDPESPGAVEQTVAEPLATGATPPCPEDMVLVKGQHCTFVEQPCLQWNDPDGQPLKRVCAQFEKPSRCMSERHPMLFCIDRQEYTTPGDYLPARGVSWKKAQMTCRGLGKRLCTNVEWEFACEGEEGLPYPYGYQRSAALCNQDRLLRDGRRHARADMREPPHPTCASPFGVLDMVGNVDEWVRQPQGKPGHRSELRGGWWMTGRNRCRANTSHHDEKYSGIQTGFRCCADPAEGASVGAQAALDPGVTGR